MGLHVHDIFRFDFNQVGLAPLYFFVFFPNNLLEDRDNHETQRVWFETFSSMIGNEGIAISDRSTDISWIFEQDLPSYISPHAFMRAIILVERAPGNARKTRPDNLKSRRVLGHPSGPTRTSLRAGLSVRGETVRVFGRPEELAERLEASAYDILASEIRVGLELNLPCLVVTGQGSSGYRIIEEFLPEAA